MFARLLISLTVVIEAFSKTEHTESNDTFHHCLIWSRRNATNGICVSVLARKIPFDERWKMWCSSVLHAVGFFSVSIPRPLGPCDLNISWTDAIVLSNWTVSSQCLHLVIDSPCPWLVSVVLETMSIIRLNDLWCMQVRVKLYCPLHVQNRINSTWEHVILLLCILSFADVAVRKSSLFAHS